MISNINNNDKNKMVLNMNNLNDIEMNIIQYLGSNGHISSKVTLGDDNILYTDTAKLLKQNLSISTEDLTASLESMDKKGCIVLYFDSAYIHLSNSGEETYNNLK
jgi:hypothetical protein